jgi:hypothetical protein
MQVNRLSPLPDQKAPFAWSYHVTVPNDPGCYALVTFGGAVLYVGLATGSVRNRMAGHLDDAAKRKGADVGVPFWFYYILRSANEVPAIERGWMNQAVLNDGEMPPLNRIYSPI